MTLWLWMGVAGNAFSFSLHLDPQEVQATLENGTLSIALPNAPILDVPQSPKLPTLPVSLLLPYGTRATHVTVQAREVQPIAQGSLPRVTWAPPPGIESHAPSLPSVDPALQSLSSPLRGFQNGSLAGYPVAGLLITPFRYDTTTQTLFLLTDITVTVETEPAPPGRFPQRVTPRAWSQIQRRIRRLVVNPEAEPLSRPPVMMVDPSPSIVLPPPVNPVLDPTVGPYELVILTDTTLLEPFLDYAAWHALQGQPTAVFTFAWVESHFPGSDRAERVRTFLQEAYETWGIQAVLLAADAPLSPVRTFYQDPYWGSPADRWPPADLYFACLDGDWNADGDATFGEVEDSVDALPELSVGRIPVETPAQAWAFVNKAKAYTLTLANPGFPHRALALGTDLWGGYEGAIYTEQVVSSSWPTNLEIFRMYETDTTDNTMSDFLDALQQGVGQLYINAHAIFHFFMINMNPGVSFGFGEIPLLNNANRYPFVNIVACDVGGWDLHAIMEPWLRTAEKGAIGILTVTRLDFPDVEVTYNTTTYQAIFDSTAAWVTQGDALDAQTQFWEYTGYLSLMRYLYLSRVLLGDPTLPLWTDSLRALIVSHPDTLFVGRPSMTIQVRDAGTDLPIPQARVTAYKADEVYVVQETDANGQAVLTVHPETPGPLILSVHARNAIPSVDTLWVVPGPFAPRFTLLGFNDLRAGDQDGNADAGEIGFLQVQLTNEGGVPGNGVWVRWILPDPEIQTVPMTPTFVVLPPGSTTTPFPIPLRISPFATPGPHPILLYAGESETGLPPPLLTPHTPIDTLYIDVHAPSVRVVRWIHALHGDTLHLWPELWNTGNDDARSLQIYIHPGPGIFEAIDTLYDAVITLAPGEGYLDTTDAPIMLRIDPNHLSQIYETWFVEEARGIVDTFVHWNAEVLPVTGLAANPAWPGVSLSWSRDPSHAGFLVFRRIGVGGPIERLTPLPIPQVTFEDPGAPSGVSLTYWIVAIDSLGNSAPRSESLLTYAGLPVSPGWPQIYGVGGESHHPTVADLDPNSPGLEIAFGTVTGWVYLFHADGTLADGWPVPVDGEIWNAPAVGDLDGDGTLELVVAPFRGDTAPNRVYAFEADGTLVTGWPVDYSPGSGRGSYAPPLVGDLDGDGAPEVFVHHIHGDIYAWHGDGTSYLPGTDGFFAEAGNGGFHGGFLALADLDNDGTRELICSSYDPNVTLAVFDPQGNPKPGFPLAAGYHAVGGVAVGDLDPATPGLEIAFIRKDGPQLVVVDATGNVLPGWPQSVTGNGAIYMQPSLGDLDGDGVPEILVNVDTGVLAFHGDGSLAQSFLYDEPLGQIFSQPIAVDVDGDGQDEVFCAYREGWLYGWRSDGQPWPGLPLFLAEELKTTPAIVDLQGDGTLDLVVLGTDRLTVFTMPGTQVLPTVSWPMHAHDAGNTNALTPPLPKSALLSQPVPTAPALQFLPPWPNPARAQASFRLVLPKSQVVRLRVFDITGRCLSTLANGRLHAGTYIWHWPIPASNQASGLYFIRLETPGLRKTYPLVLTH